MLPFALLIAAAICFQTASAQFPIKIPKINKPKTAPHENRRIKRRTIYGGHEFFRAERAESNTENRPAQTSKDQPNNLDDPERPKVPQILLETLEIKAHNQAKYWKTPKDNDNPSWFPQVSFRGFLRRRYADFALHRRNGRILTVRSWFSEPLEMNYSEIFPLCEVRMKAKI